MSKIINATKIQRLHKEARLNFQAGKIKEAKLIYQDLLKTLPLHPEILGELGTIELQLGNSKSGVDYLKKSIKINPHQYIYLKNIGNGLIDLDQIEDSIFYFNAALKINSKASDIYYNKARALRRLKKYKESIENYQLAIQFQPDNYIAYLNLGFLFNEIQDYYEALTQYNAAIKIAPKIQELYYNKGITLENLRQFKDALEEYNKALMINQNFEPVLFNKCGVLIKLKLLNEAKDTINKLIEINPHNSDYFIKLGIVYEELKDFEKAIFNYDFALQLNSNACTASLYKSLIKLSNNFFQEGWCLYENRWQTTQKEKYLKTSKPELTDFNITHKTIFIWAEQGIGDQILYGSLLSDAFKTKNHFYVSLDPRLIKLFRRSFSDADHATFISTHEGLIESNYDFHLPIGNLGKFFRNSIEDFHSHSRAFLQADAMQVRNLRNKIKNNAQKICGISWMSKNNEIGKEKSLSLTELLPIISIPDTTFINLQYGEVKEEINFILNQYGIEISMIDEIDNFNDLDGLASLINTCDYVVTSSSVTAHIAGALNKETYLLLPYALGRIWYWGESENKCLWYPSIRIHRCNENGLWSDPIEEIRTRLRDNKI